MLRINCEIFRFYANLKVYRVKARPAILSQVFVVKRFFNKKSNENPDFYLLFLQSVLPHW